jgi:hypothetical protein
VAQLPARYRYSPRHSSLQPDPSFNPKPSYLTIEFKFIMDSAKLLFLASQYGILLQFAEHFSTLDVLHLALTCRELYSRIRSSTSIFKHLKRVAICDGHGLTLRQNFAGLYALTPRDWEWRKGRPARPCHTVRVIPLMHKHSRSRNED